ncbi:MAG: hypothetical protein HY744_18890 [Deltaproteobacteria bacterium]|nr:hypothetical protein [Deltaproteobacteria bacterium]
MHASARVVSLAGALLGAACGCSATPAPAPPAGPPGAGSAANIVPEAPAPGASAPSPATAAATVTPAERSDQPPRAVPTFEDDVAFLDRYGAVQILQAPHGARVAVSAKYQGRVMTSAVGPGERSLGWVQRDFIEKGRTGTQFDNYGGEDRFWLGPEGGQFGLYFAPGKTFALSAWQTPAAFQEGEWAVSERDDRHIALHRSLAVTNHSGTRFDLDVTRAISLLPAAEVTARLGAPIPAGVSWVAFQSANTITNRGKLAWSEKKGLLSVWILAMFPPSPDTLVVVPFRTDASGPIVNDAYFGKVPPGRLQVHEREGYLVFKGDALHRSKIGLGPARAKPTLGSFSAASRLLTIVQYDPPQGPARYVNSMWEAQADPFAGDAVNSYNDGPTAPGQPPLGGFYELETSSPGGALRPAASLTHTHRTFHLVGEPAALDAVARAALGVPLDRIRLDPVPGG